MKHKFNKEKKIHERATEGFSLGSKCCVCRTGITWDARWNVDLDLLDLSHVTIWEGDYRKGLEKGGNSWKVIG